ncbi:ATP-dependent DNA helicase [Noviherbaspirillum sp. UKPF54]|uniref:ATP-dependent DNA helicase n=1 Tax=Noviherbaspirillum sp. UKPF54 TaxID=2601898 RepID=UPI0011B117A7|nr:ATP-dependent DNA helicase [Noviherbaspirillum sp. UKPF54]QDZ27753.1 ATP-dependent DNA helicase [Noviherbaspirillum sp. UKPF54]
MAGGRRVKYTVAVRALTEFTARKGDLDLRFTPSPSAQEGIAGHGAVTARRAAGYHAEVSLSGQYKHLLVRGRADGYDPALNQLEEIKTYKGKFDAIPDNHRHLHWAQAKMYGWLLCQKMGLSELRLALVYFEIGSQTETVLVEEHAAAELQRYFEEQCERFLAWADRELAHRAARDQALAALRFPHAAFRPGQRQLAEAAYRAASSGRCLMAQAPTGIGKTVGTMFPLLKACPTQELDKIFFLTAKTSGRALALDALGQIRRSAPALPLRTLELIARDKACEHPDKACHGESCPLARGFYDRLPQARQAALAAGALDRAATRAVALEHGVCPYYLGQELARWCDVVVGDYNYYFDSSALLHGLTLDNQWHAAVLVDEAHNLIERARKMYSAELDQAAFHFMRQSAPAALKKSLDRLNRAWNALHKEQGEPYRAYPEIPSKFAGALQQAISAVTDFLAENPTYVNSGLQRFYFDALHFSRLSESFDTHSLFDVAKEQHGAHVRSTLCIRNILPAPFLAPRFATARTTTLFSATLSPWHFYRDMLGMPQDTACIDVESPFTAEQLTVRIAGRISTRYRQRAQSLAPIAELMARQYRERPGNYLAFLSSFDYLRDVAELFRARHPDIPTWEQSRRMDEQEREQFLARFTPEGCGIGFAVLGGAFAEGIDLPGERLVGAFVATLGLPQFNPVNEQIRERMEAAFGAGHDYAYLYPGLQKVVQAAGRVIRTQSDRGVVYLIDDRFARLNVRALLPRWWKVEPAPES